MAGPAAPLLGAALSSHAYLLLTVLLFPTVPAVGHFVAGLALSWSLAAPPGPANALIAQEGARRGAVAGLLTGLGACAGDLVMFLLMWLGVLRVLGDVPGALALLAAAGSLLMAKFAYDAWTSARRPPRAAEGRGSFGRSFVTVLTSPFNWGWWLTAGTTLVADLGWVVMVGFFVGLVAWVATWVAVSRAGSALFARFAEFVGYAAAFVLAVFSVVIGWFAVRAALSSFY